MGKVLIAAQQRGLRNQVARVVASAGYAVELAESEKEALEVAAGGDFDAAIIVGGASPTTFASALRDKIPRTIIVREQAGTIVRRKALGGAYAFREQDFNEQELL